MNAPAKPGRPERTERLVVELGAAFQQRAVYSREHPQVARAVARTLAAFATWCEEEGAAEVSIVTLEDQLLVDRNAIPEDSPWARGLLQAFRRYSIRGMTLLRGLDAAEIAGFFDSCNSATGAATSTHILLGQAGFSVAEIDDHATAVGVPVRVVPAWLTAEQKREARAELVAAATGTASRIDRLRALVSRLARAAESGGLDALRLELESSEDAAFVHGLAVALATLRLGRALGLQAEALDDLALAAMLHDIGYLEPPLPDESPAERRERHPVRGAARLAALEDLPEVAVLVAYEHHLRVDGVANYPASPEPRTPGPAAQLVAVADTWETLRSRGELSHDEALEGLRSRAGTYLDPSLVELFAELVTPPGA
jgi:hypothetical protein